MSVVRLGPSTGSKNRLLTVNGDGVSDMLDIEIEHLFIHIKCYVNPLASFASNCFKFIFGFQE